MKRCGILLVLGFAVLTGRAVCDPQHEHGHHHDHRYKFSIHQKDYRFSTGFEMDSHGAPHGSVVKSSLRWLKPLRDSYDVYDKNGERIATGISRIFCLGFSTHGELNLIFTIPMAMSLA